MDFIIARGAAFRAQLTPDDIVGLYTAKWLFHASSLVPFLLYHAARLPDLRPRFPCTISWTIRKGVPKHVQHGIWLAGWAQMLFVLRRNPDGGSAAAATFGVWFAAQMIATGVVGVVLAPVGVSARHDLAHYISSGVYMVDHCVMMPYLAMSAPYRAAFFASLLLFFYFTARLKRVKHDAGLVHPPDASADWVAKARAALPRDTRERVWRVECLEMVFEYALFIAFVSGMTSGLGDNGGVSVTAEAAAAAWTASCVVFLVVAVATVVSRERLGLRRR